MGLQALSVQQPWAWAIAHAGKNIENRTKPTYMRGTIAIHASQEWLKNEKHPFRNMPVGCKAEIWFGAIVAIADLVDCVEAGPLRWFTGPYGWVLDNIHPLKMPVPCKGMLGLWRVPPSKVAAIKRQLSKRDQ